MKVLVFYRDLSDHGRTVNDYLRDFYRQTGRQLETLDPDTREGERMCRTYDIVEYPTLVALDDRGIVQNLWRGLPLPTISEVSYYAQ